MEFKMDIKDLFRKKFIKKCQKINSSDFVYIADLVQLEKECDFIYRAYIRYMFNIINISDFVINIDYVDDYCINLSIDVIFSDCKDYTVYVILMTESLIKKIHKKTKEIYRI